MFLFPNLELKFYHKIENLYNTHSIISVLNNEKEEAATEESRHFQGELLKPHRLKEEGPHFSVLLVITHRDKKGERGNY